MTYCYETRSGIVIEKCFPMGKAPKEIKVKGRIARRSFAAESASVPATAGWPMECIASGVHADQAGDLRKCFDKAGVPTQVSPDGNPIYRDMKHRRKALKARGILDRSAYV